MVATILEIPSNIFNFCGQVHLDTYALDIERVAVDFDRYDDVAVNGLRLSLEAIESKRTRSRTGSAENDWASQRTRSALSSSPSSFSSFLVLHS